MLGSAFRPLAAAGAFALLAGCASTPVPAPIAAVAIAPTPPPARPAGLPETVLLPPLAPDGRYATINHDLSPAATVWHVRSALNVAALGCRSPQEADLVATYNRLLTVQKTALAKADAAYRAEFRAADPVNWQTEHDRRITRVYNFFAQPLAAARFCAEASAIAHEADQVPDFALEPFAKLALIRLEAPFTDAYRAYAGWQAQYAAWAAGAPPPAPQLAYAPFETVIAWAPVPATVQQAALARPQQMATR